MANTTKASGKLVFGVDFNNANALTAINAMKRDVRNLATEMRNTESSFRASGESMQAMTTKVNSLKTIIEQQTNLVKQAKAAEDAYGKTTDADGIKLQRLANEHKAAENQLKSYQRQLERAQVVLQQYDSSLLKSRENSRTWTNLLGTTKKELESSGQAYTRNSELTKTYSQSVNALTTQLDAEQKTLKNIEELDRRSGMKEHSQEYLQQASNVKKVSTELNKARHEMKDYVSGYTELTARTKSYGQATTDIVARLNAEKKSVSANVAELARLKSERGAQAKIVQLEAGKLKELDGTLRNTEAYDKQVSALNKAQKKYAETSEQIKLLNKNYGGLGQTSARLGDHLVNIGNKATTLGDKFSRASQTTTQASTAVIGAFVYGSKKAIDLQDSFVKTTNLVLDNGKATKNYAGEVKNLGQMQADASKLSMKYGVAQQEIADGYQELIKRGYTSAQALGAQNDLLKASVASGDSYKETVNTATAAMESFGLTTDKAGRPLTNTKLMTERTSKSLTEMTYAANRTATDFGSMGVAMEYVGNTAHQANFSLSETSAAIGILSNNGLEADKAGTGLRKTINSLISPTKNGKEALKDLGLSMKDFTDNNGNLKDMSTIFGLLQEKMAGMKGKERNDIFHALFGTTGQAAGGILVSNSKALSELNKETENSYKNNYMGKLADKNQESAKQQLKIFKATLDSISMTLAKDWLPVVTDMAKKLNGWLQNVNKLSDGHKKLLTGIALGIPTFTLLTGALSAVLKIIGGFGKVGVGMLNFLGAGRSKATQQTESVLALTASINNLTKATEEYNLTGGLKTSAPAGQSYVPKGEKVTPQGTTTYMPNGDAIAAQTVEKVGKSSKWNLLGKSVGARIFNGLGLAMSVADVGGSIYKAATSNKSNEKYKAAGKTVGTLVGGGIGALFGGPAGAMFGAQIGDALGSSKTATKIAKKITKGINKALHGEKIKAPELDSKGAKKALEKNSKLYKDQQLKDLKTLKDSGNLTDAEYKKRVKAVTDSYNKQKKAMEKGGKDQTLVAKYYSKQKQSIDTSYNKARKKVHDKYDAQVLQAEQTFGKHSSQYKKIASKRDKALDEASSKHKKKMSDLNIKYAEHDMTQEAKAHLTLSGKIQTQATKQTSILTKLKNSKGKLSQITVFKMISDAQKEYDETVKLADQRYNKIAKAADSQRAKVAKAADNQYKATKASAEEQYKKTVAAAKNQYKGNSKAAEKQRKAVVDKAEKQKKDTIAKAKKQKTDTVAKADKQRQQVTDKAEKQRRQVTDKAEKQKNSVKETAKSQGYAVEKASVKQANNSMNASKKQASGTQSIWNKLAGWWGGFLKWVGVGAPSKHYADFSYTPAAMHGGYAIGGQIKKNGMAFVGEAGPELRYKPYSGKVDIVGQQGAQFIKLEAGDKILNAMDTKKVLSGQFKGTLPGYAKGNWSLGSFLSKAKDLASSVWDNVSDKALDFFDGIKSPLKTMNNLASSAFNLNTVPHAGTGAKQFSKGAVKKSINGLVTKFNQLKKTIESSFASNPGGSGVKRWTNLVKKALRMNGLPASPAYVRAWLSQINTESGGNPKAVQGYIPGDPNNGNPARGLLQTIPPTFAANAFAGHKNIYNGFDNMLAGIRYAKNRYGSAMLQVIGHGHGYANGGIVNKHQMIEVAENNMPEAVVPLTKGARAWKLLQKVISHYAGPEDNRDNFGTDKNSILLDSLTTIINQHETENRNLQNMISLLMELVNVATNPNATNSQRENIRSIEQLMQGFNLQKGRGRLS